MNVAVLGPNLSREQQALGQMHVHAEGCGDIKRRYRPGEQKEATTLTVDSRAEVVTAIYDPDDFQYDPETELANYEQDFYWAPCVKELK